MRIDIDALLGLSASTETDQPAVGENLTASSSSDSSRKKRKPSSHYLDLLSEAPSKAKKAKKESSSSRQTLSAPGSSGSLQKSNPITIKIPRLASTTFPCCLCTSLSHDNLLRLQDPPPASATPHTRPTKRAVVRRLYDASLGRVVEVESEVDAWMAHERCARVIPETWIDELDGERLIFGVDSICKERWNLVRL